MVSLSVFTVVGRTKTLLAIYLGVVMLGNKTSWITYGLGVISIFGVTLVICPSIYGLSDSGSGLEIGFSVKEVVGLAAIGGFMLLDVLASIVLIKMAGTVPYQ